MKPRFRVVQSYDAMSSFISKAGWNVITYDGLYFIALNKTAYNLIRSLNGMA